MKPVYRSLSQKLFNRYVAISVIILLAFATGLYPLSKKKPRNAAEVKQLSKKEKAPVADGPISADLNLPAVQSFVAENGLKVFYIKDDMPQLTVMVTVGFGKLYEDRQNAGISELLAKVITLGGSKKYPGESLYSAVEKVGGRFSVSATWEGTVIAIRVLERHADLAFDIISDILKNPNLEEQYINDAKSLLCESIRRKKDSPDTIAFEKLREIIFDGNGYGSFPREDAVKLIPTIELAKALNTYFNAENMIVGISSSIEWPAIKKYIAANLSGLEKGKRMYYHVDYKKITDSISANSKKIFLLPRPLPQATIVAGTIAPPISDPSAFSLSVMNYILGEGSFNSRLMQEIRVKRGLAYAVQSVVKFRRDTGVFIAFAQTKNEESDTTLSIMLENIFLMKDRPVSEEELRWAKNSIIRSYIFEFETPLDVLNQYQSIYYNSLPDTYLKEYPTGINNVSGEMISAGSRELLKSGLVRLVVGDESLKKKLSRFGEVVIINP